MPDTKETIDPSNVCTIIGTVRNVFPDAEVGEDLDGQIVIYTGIYQTNERGNNA